MGNVLKFQYSHKIEQTTDTKDKAVKELSPKEFEERSKLILWTYGSVSEEEINAGVKRQFEELPEFIHILEIRPDDGSKPYFIHRDSIERM